MDTVPNTSPFAKSAWIRTWLWTAGVGTLLLVVYFLIYEIAERTLLSALSQPVLWRLHTFRGAFAGVLIGTWTFINVWRMRRNYDRAFSSAYHDLRKQMERRSEELAHAQRFTERLFDAIRDRIYVVDESGNILKSNELAGGFCPGESVAASVIRSGEPIHGEIVSATASNRLYAVDGYPVSDGDRRLALVVARDVTRAKQLEMQLRNQEKLAALGVLAAGIAHDIANPLASMSSELEMCETEVDLDQVHQSLAVVRNHLSRIDRTLRDMTGFARRCSEGSGSVDVDAAVKDALRMVQHDRRARNVRFSTRITPDLPPANMAEDHLVMVLINLLINALDAMPSGGDIEIAGEQVGDYIHISIHDSGVGMSEEVLRRATEPLFTTKPGGQGTGLGLSISADVLRQAGGSLDIASRPGMGTTVHLSCPKVIHA